LSFVSGLVFLKQEMKQAGWYTDLKRSSRSLKAWRVFVCRN